MINWRKVLEYVHLNSVSHWLYASDFWSLKTASGLHNGQSFSLGLVNYDIFLWHLGSCYVYYKKHRWSSVWFWI